MHSNNHHQEPTPPRPTPRTIGEKELAHDRLGDRFTGAISQYDTQRRVEVLVDEFLAEVDLTGLTALDVGCGAGHFSQRLMDRGADVTACDLGPNLVEQTRTRVGCRAVVADALRLSQQFGRDRFDVVLSSECIEHTPDPPEALRQMVAVLKPGGWISVSTPNLLWYPMVRAATLLRLRPFDGHENFSTWPSLRKTLGESGVEIVREKGLHLFPFQLRMHRLSRWLDQRLQRARFGMINLCLLGRKLDSEHRVGERG